MTSLVCDSTKNHCAATICIQVPMLETNCAMNKARNTRLRNGAEVDGCTPSARSCSRLTLQRFVGGPHTGPALSAPPPKAHRLRNLTYGSTPFARYGSVSSLQLLESEAVT